VSVEAPLFAAPAAGSAPSAGGGTLEVTLALLLVVGVIAGLAWLFKRMRGFGTAGQGRIQVLGDRALGPKERCVLVRVGETDILIGVAANAVTTLHVFPAGANTDAPPPLAPLPGAPAAPSFKDLLLRSLGK
jgi:flagellar protein FliO/FliZ